MIVATVPSSAANGEIYRPTGFVGDAYGNDPKFSIRSVPEDEEKVNSPSHYQGAGGLEVIDVIEKFEVGDFSSTSGFNLGNLLKYVLRAGKKEDYLQDLKKAQWYLNREIGNEEARLGV